MKVTDKNITRKESITVDFFYRQAKDRFDLKLFTDESGFERIINQQNLHRPGLALAGFVELFSYDRVQIVGNTEVRYLKKLTKKERSATLKKIFNFEVPCIIFTNGHIPSSEVIKLANEHNIPLFGSSFTTTKLTYLVGDLLDDQFEPRLSLHGSFVDVYGVGMLFVGKSGIGKSEIALDLVERGHRLVADDLVIFTKKGEGILMGAGTKLAQHIMEIRGIGIIDVRSMFGIRAIRFQKRLEMVVELEVWDDQKEYTRTGLDGTPINLLDVETPYLQLPIFPGKNITVISEVIALNYLLKHYGHDAAKEFQDRLLEKMQKKSKEVDRVIDYFEHDFE